MRAILSVAWLALLINYIHLPVVAAELSELTTFHPQKSNTDTVSSVHLLSKEPISVLLVATNSPSRLTRIAALGEALVLRGHNVTLCSTEREGDELPKQLANRTGMTFLSAGPDLQARKQDVLDVITSLQNKSMLKMGYEAVKLQPEIARRIAKKLRSDPSYASAWDIMVIDAQLTTTLTCLSLKWSVPIVTFKTTFEWRTANTPRWSYPLPATLYTPNMTFVQRLLLVPFTVVAQLFQEYMKMIHLESIDFDCSEYYHQLKYANEGSVPAILTVAMGFEYPHPFLPMMHYVGPLLLRPQKTISGDLNRWLANKPDSSVIYISMGTTIQLTKEMGGALINGSLSTNYSVLWSLRASNHDILEGYSLDKERFHSSNWVPQQEILRNKAIKLAVLHCGMGGVSEALHSAVPLVVIPFMFDQYGVASRVMHAGAGMYLDRSTMTADKVQSAIETVASPEYKKAAKKLQKIFLQAGGAERAADLVEFYEEVGYDHLIPAYLKYKWSWVQFYNVDVWAIISLVILSVVLIVSKVCNYCFCSRCYRRKTKTE